MSALIAIDGYSLNENLQCIAAQNKNNRIKIDYNKLLTLLLDQFDVESEYIVKYYIDQPISFPETTKHYGKVSKYFPERGYGFIVSADGNSYFFHKNDILNKVALRRARERAYPSPSSKDFSKRLCKRVVSFTKINDGDDNKAENLTIIPGAEADIYYQLRKEAFLSMLEEKGYTVVRCQPLNSPLKGKSKSVDLQIMADAMSNIHKGDDFFVLLSDDPCSATLLEAMAKHSYVALATFNSQSGKSLMSKLMVECDTVMLDELIIEEIQLESQDSILQSGVYE